MTYDVCTTLTRFAWCVMRMQAAPIQRADLARYIVVMEYGGWYLDLDVGVACQPTHHLDRQLSRQPDRITDVCTNVVDTLEDAVGLNLPATPAASEHHM